MPRGLATGSALAFLLIFLCVRPAGAQEQRAFLILFLNEVEKGEVLVVIKGPDVLIGVDALSQVGLEDVGGQRETIGGGEFVSLASLAPDVRFQFDEQLLTLRVTASPTLLGSTRRDLQVGTPADLVYLRNSSGFVNYAFTWRGSAEFDLFTEMGWSIGGAFLSNTLSMTNGRTPVRGLTSLTVDEPQKLRRWTVGDTLASSGPLGGDLFIGGISVSREFSIQPYFHRYPSLSMAGAVTTPSTLELYVNERLVRTEDLAPGQFELTNLPLASGINDARIIIKDAFGNVREVSESYYLTTTTLSPGLHDYRYSVGFQRRGIGAASPWAYGRPVVLGHHRKGFTTHLTAGGRLEVGTRLLSGGPIVNLRLPFGELEAVAGVSQGRSGRGAAGSLSFTHAGRRISFGVTVQPATRHYAAVSTMPGVDRPRFEISGFASAQAWGRANVTLQHSQARTRDGEARERTSLLASARVTRKLDLVASGTRGLQDGRPVRQLFAGLTLSFGTGDTATVAAERLADHVQTVAEVRRPMPVGTGYGYRLRAEDGARRLWTGTLEYQNKYGRYEMHRERVAGVEHTRLSATGGLVTIGGGVYASRPIQSSFALVRVPQVRGVRAYANHQEVGRTNGKGDLLIPDLLSYYGNLVNISDEDIPLNYEIGRVQMTIAPPHRGGALVTFPVTRVQSTVGTVRLEARGQITVPAYGKLTMSVDGRPVSSPVGANGEFYFDNLTPGRHRTVLEYAGRSCAFDVEIPPSKSSVNQLGAVTCIALEQETP